MARTVKAKTETTSTTTPAPVVETPPVVVEAPVTTTTTEKKVKKAKTTKAETTEVVAPVVVEEVKSTPVVVEGGAPVTAEVSAPVSEQSVEFVAKLQQLSVLISSLKTEYKTMERHWARELKNAQKQSSKRKRKAGNRAPSGFVKPTRISDELAKFLEKPAGAEMARTEVTRDINKYIRTNNLQDKENGRKINPDAKLSALLKLKKTDELTYFNLQRFMSPHFAKAAKEGVSA